MGIDLLGVADNMLQNVPRGYIQLTAVLVSLIVGGAVIWFYFFKPYHFLTVQKGVLYRDGFRTEREYNIAIAEARPNWVVCLLDKDELIKEPYKSSFEYLSRTKIKIRFLPIKLGGFPTTADVQEFLKIATTPHYQPVLVHCAQGIRRTGMMVAVYQMSVMGWDKEKTKSEIQAFGHSDRTINDIKRFIDVYDPVKREVTQDLGKGVE